MAYSLSVNMSQEEAETLREFINAAGREGEKQGDTLKRLLAIAAKELDDEILRENQVDTKGLNASLENIRAIFLQLVGSQEEIQKNFDRQIDEERSRHRQTEATLQEKIEQAETEKQTAFEEKEKAIKEKEEAEKECRIATEAKDAAVKEAEDKARISAMLEKSLADATQKLESYPQILKDVEKLEADKEEMGKTIEKLNRTIEDIGRAIEDGKAEAERLKESSKAKIEQIKKEHEEQLRLSETQAELTLANALREAEQKEMEKERLLSQQIRDAVDAEHKASEELALTKGKLEEMQKAYERLQKSYDTLEELAKKK